MSSIAQGALGKSRTCPHCRATILQSASICPLCGHSLRFDALAGQRTRQGSTALRVEGTIHHPPVGEPVEYSMVLSIRNERGDEITRQMVGIGALRPDEQRTFTLAVEVLTPSSTEAAKRR
ncbi:MAG: hypothetical protein H7Z74_12485 [Anaerolineae bacterium]|nr:hypothetical protein [Gemmatimonadaceae bacterium]